VPPPDFEHFRSELASLRKLLGTIPGRTVRDESFQDRVRNLFRVWISVVFPQVAPAKDGEVIANKLTGELEMLAELTSKNKPVAKYRERINRCVWLTKRLAARIPYAPQGRAEVQQPESDELFVQGIPDLPMYLVPNALVGWRSAIGTFVEEHPYDRSVFLMVRYRSRNEQLIRSIKASVGKHDLSLIVARDHRLTDNLDNAVACLLCCSRGIAVFDEPDPEQVFSPNVAYELGIMHTLGRDCLILKHSAIKALHTDILSKLYCEYGDPGEAVQHLSNWLEEHP
jgi:hypothetical protein